MPVAGKAVHVRRLVVVRSRCGLEVSPASPAVHMAADREKVSSGNNAQLRAASTSAGGCGVEDQVGRAGVTSLHPRLGVRAPIRGRNIATVIIAVRAVAVRGRWTSYRREDPGWTSWLPAGISTSRRSCERTPLTS